MADDALVGHGVGEEGAVAPVLTEVAVGLFGVVWVGKLFVSQAGGWRSGEAPRAGGRIASARYTHTYMVTSKDNNPEGEKSAPTAAWSALSPPRQPFLVQSGRRPRPTCSKQAVCSGVSTSQAALAWRGMALHGGWRG